MLVWVIYDISEDKIRNKVSRYCLDYGLYRVQKSVFLGDLNGNERDSIALQCEEVFVSPSSLDRLISFFRHPFKKVKLIGQAFDKELVSDEVITKFF